jgi:hypothetical protein
MKRKRLRRENNVHLSKCQRFVAERVTRFCGSSLVESDVLLEERLRRLSGILVSVLSALDAAVSLCSMFVEVDKEKYSLDD